jgi:catechol 2,3-dioxygenase-like lactoylglutathione lyase family enzyme
VADLRRAVSDRAVPLQRRASEDPVARTLRLAPAELTLPLVMTESVWTAWRRVCTIPAVKHAAGQTAMRFHHVSITTQDLERLRRFYIDQLHFETVLELEWGTGTEVADRIYGLRDTAVRMNLLRLDGVFLELFEFRSPTAERPPGAPQVNTPGYTHLCLQVADIEAEYERLCAAGMTFTCPPQSLRGIGKATYGRDPDGNLIELLEPAPGSAFDPTTAKEPR